MARKSKKQREALTQQLYLTGFAQALEYAMANKKRPERIDAQYNFVRKQLYKLKGVV